MNRAPPRLLLVTDGRGDAARVRRVVEAALRGGCDAVQLREPGLTARELADLCVALRPAVAAAEARLLVNDRADLVAAGLADGVQLGHRSLPVGTVRGFLPDAWIGASVHDGVALAEAAGEGADAALLSPVFPTTCKPGAVTLGAARAGRLTAAATLPVLWLGGLDAAGAVTAAAHGAAGIAVRSALCDAVDPATAARALRDAFDAARSGQAGVS